MASYEIKKTCRLVVKVTYSQNVFHFGSNIQQKMLNHYPEYYPAKEREDAQNCFEDWSQSEKFSNIKPPLFLE